MPIDLMEIDIRSIYDNLSKILGETYDDDVINQLFSQFCLGK
jgi:tRNA modification GTPase